MRALRSVEDLTDADVGWVVSRAREHKVGGTTSLLPLAAVVGLAFFETSLRTRTGFAAATGRLGGSVVEIDAVRTSAVSMPESVEDTLRVLAGYCDVVVARVDRELVAPEDVRARFVSAGDRGPAAEHPSQALIDLFAIDQHAGGLADVPRLTIALCGDLRMRVARSLLALLARTPPARLVFVTDSALEEGLELPPALVPLVERRTLDELGDVDVLHVVGMHYDVLQGPDRDRLIVTDRHLDGLPAGAVVLSPGPVIDEMTPAALRHPTVRIFAQSDDGLFVRMAVLELLLGSGPD